MPGNHVEVTGRGVDNAGGRGLLQVTGIRKEVIIMKGFIEEFKEFISRGNVMDMAVGVIIGGAFGTIVTSLVNDIIMPLFGALTAGMDFKSLKYVLNEPIMDGATVIKPEAAILYGNFIQNRLNNHKTHTEQHQEAANHNNKLTDCFLQEITANVTVSLPEIMIFHLFCN